MYELKEGDFDPPGANQQFAQILKSRGNNLHEVEPAVFPEPTQNDDDDQTTTTDKTFLVSMPTKFRKNIWVKRGSFVIIEMIAEGQKVKGEIARILLPEHIKEFKKDGIWPAKFVPKSNAEQARPSKEPENNSGSDDQDEPIERNTNRWYAQSDEESSEEDSDGSSYDEPEIETNPPKE